MRNTSENRNQFNPAWDGEYIARAMSDYLESQKFKVAVKQFGTYKIDMRGILGAILIELELREDIAHLAFRIDFGIKESLELNIRNTPAIQLAVEDFVARAKSYLDRSIPNGEAKTMLSDKWATPEPHDCKRDPATDLDWCLKFLEEARVKGVLTDAGYRAAWAITQHYPPPDRAYMRSHSQGVQLTYPEYFVRIIKDGICVFAKAAGGTLLAVFPFEDLAECLSFLEGALGQPRTLGKENISSANTEQSRTQATSVFTASSSEKPRAKVRIVETFSREVELTGSPQEIQQQAIALCTGHPGELPNGFKRTGLNMEYI